MSEIVRGSFLQYFEPGVVTIGFDYDYHLGQAQSFSQGIARALEVVTDRDDSFCELVDKIAA